MLKRVFFPLLLLLTCLAAAQDVKVEKYKLPNGMTVILHEDHSLPVVNLNLWFHVGSKDERPGRTGFAHLFEHLMFMGTERAPGSQFDQIMEAGGGSNNATTSTDRTEYYADGPAGLLPTLLWLEADRMEDLGRMMTQEKLNLQRDVVRNERRENFENTPYGELPLRLCQMLYPAGHPYHYLPIGSHEDLEAATVADVKDFFATYYVPNNASLVVAGDFDPLSVKPLIAALFGTLPRKNDPYHGTAQPVRLNSVERATLVDEVSVPKLVMSWHSPGYYKPGDAELDLAGAILSDGVSSRLYNTLVTEKELATDVSAYQASQLLGSVFTVEATPAEGTDLDVLEKEIDAALKDFLAKPPTKAEMDRQIAKIEFGSMNQLQSLSGRASQLNEYEFYFGEPNSFKRDVDRYRNATIAGVQATAKSVLDFDRRVIIRVVPQSQTPQENPRAQKPPVPEEKPFSPQMPSEFKLDSGVPVYYWHRPTLPLMYVTAVFKGGAALDPAEKAGAASMMAGMMSQGAGELSAIEFEQALDEIGGNFGANAGRLATTVSMSSLASKFPQALTLYHTALTKPTFDSEDWQRVQEGEVQYLKESLQEPTTMASIVGSRELFGPSTIYGRPIGGVPETVARITVDDLRGSYGKIIGPNNMALFAAGSLPEAEFRAQLNKQFKGWSGGPSVPTITAPERPTRQDLRVVIVDKPQAVQTVIRFAFPASSVTDPSRIPLETVTTIFGGTFTSRINAKLREEKGYSYGAGSGLAQDPLVGSLIASSNVRADVTGPALREFLAEISRLGTGDITAEELTKARKALRTSTIQSLSNLGSLVGTAVALYIDGRPFSGLAEDMKAIAEMDLPRVNEIARTAMDLKKGVLVLVGDKDLITKQMEGLNLPKPEIVKL